MSDTELQFRTSTFGGFQKQDVLNYIETSNQEHREKLEAVRRELAEAEAAKAAQAVQAEAEERIRKTRAEVEQWLNRVQGNYGRLRADMDAAVSRACGELDQVRQTLEQISGELARQDEGLDKLTKSCCAELTHRAPDPLPLDEK